MSPKTLLRPGLTVLVITAAACSEPLAPKLERIQSQIANAFGCTISWTGMAGDNLWQTPGNWNELRLPNGSDNVCITGDGAAVQLFGDASVNSVTVGTPGSNDPATLHVRGFRQGTGWYNLPANLNVASGIDVAGILSMDATGHGPGAVTLNIGGAGIEVRSGGIFRSLSKDFDLNGGTLTHYVNANVVNNGTLDWRTSVEMRGTYTNRGVANLQQNWRNWEWYYSYNLPNGTWIQESGSLIVDAFFTLTDGTFRLENGTITGADGPVLERGTFAIANGSSASGNVTLRNTVAMSGDVPAGLTVIAAGHSYSTTGINYQTFVTAASGFTNRGTIRLISTGHAFGQPSQLTVTNGAIDNYGRIESHVGNSQAGRTINASITNRAGAVIDIRSGTDFNKAGATYENSGTITVTPSTFVTLNGAPSFAQLGGALTLGTDAQWKQDGGSFRLAGGAITGRPWLAGIALDIPAGSPGTGTLLLTHTNTIAGDVPAGVKLHVENWRFGSTGFSYDGVLNAAASVTNFGTIVLGNPGFNPNPARVAMLNGSTLTNKGRFETVFDPAGGHRYVVGNFTNEGTLQLDNWTEFTGGIVRSLAPAAVTMGGTGNGLLDLMPGATLIASGTWPLQLVNRGALHIGAAGTAAALHLREYSGVNSSSVTVDIGGAPTAPGVDFDKLSMTGPMTIGSGTLHVRALSPCVDGGKSYDVISYSHPSGNFANFTGLDLGGGRTVQPEQLSNGYRLNVLGPVCPPPDATPPVIAPTVTGTLGNNGWYRSNVTVSWSVTDAESPVTSTSGCEVAGVGSDTEGVTFTCSATSAGGTATKSVTIKRDATAPAVSVQRAPAANEFGWNNTDVTATYSASDAMSGLAGASSATELFSAEGANQSGTHVFTDNAGNAATATATGISIDKTKPTWTHTRSAQPNANGWYNADVTITMHGADALSGLQNLAEVSMTVTAEGTGRGFSNGFVDKAGNGILALVNDVKLDKTAPVVTVTRAPLPDANGWNHTDVIVTYSATDEKLGITTSGIAGSPTFVQLFDQNGANQSGSHSFTDLAGNVGVGAISGINIDKTVVPPTVTPVCSATPNEIWPANNKPVRVSVSVGGNGITSFKLRSVTNNESGTADVEGWAIGTADVDGYVLAKRSGRAGRTYTLTYDVFGANGATGSCTVSVFVPHDQRR